MTRLPIRKSSTAQADLYEHVDYFADHNPEVGRRFMNEVEANLELLSSNPLLGTRFTSASERFSDLRYWTMAAFPNHVIFYRVEATALNVVRILHGSRDLHAAISGE